LDLLITREYVNIVKKSLKIKWQDADRLIGEKIDVDMTKLVFDTLESKNRSSVLYAMNLFDLVKKEMLSPELKKIISQKSDEIMASSLDSLFELDGEVLIPEMEDTFDEESLDVQVKEIMSLDVYQELMKKQIDKIISQEGREAEVSRMEAAKVMGMMEPSPSLIRSLNRLIRNDSPEVVSYAVESAEKLKRREFVPFIIHHLSNPYVERVAHKALVTYGDKIIGTLKDYLGDSDEAMKLRKAIPDILADIGTQRAAELLALEMGKDNKDVELEIISAMYKIKSKKPQINFPEKIISAGILMKIKESYVILNEIYELMSDKKKQFLAKDLENNLAQTLRRIFELLSLIYPHEDMIKAYQNICDGTKKALDYSIEFLDNTVKKDIMEFLLPLVEDIPLEDKVRRSRKILKSLEKTKLS
jgi:AAA family ATP:ADP antiporter